MSTIISRNNTGVIWLDDAGNYWRTVDHTIAGDIDEPCVLGPVRYVPRHSDANLLVDATMPLF